MVILVLSDGENGFASTEKAILVLTERAWSGSG